MNTDKEELIVKVINWELEYEVIERELTKTDFMEIEIGSTFDEIVEKIGKPNGWIGSGMLSPYYSIKKEKFQKQQYIILFFRYLNEDNRLKKMILVDDSKELEVLKNIEFE